MRPWRLVIDPPAAGAWNMAVDLALLEDASQRSDDVCTLRIYQWAEATLSLGYFQPAGDRAAHPASRGCPLVRRSSGGGAILHHHELTYCLVVPAATGLARQPTLLYQRLHETLARTLTLWGLEADCCRQPETASRPETFLCFQRRTHGDLLAGGHKIGGSAQRRRGGAVMQHGSVLLARSPQAPELPGISDLAGRSLEPRRLTELWLAELRQQLEVDWEPISLTAEQVELAEQLLVYRFINPEWTYKR